MNNTESNMHVWPISDSSGDAEKGVSLFLKPFLSTQQKIDLLRKRNLIIKPQEEAYVSSILESVGYYSLSGYFHFFYRAGPWAQHSFVEGTSLSFVSYYSKS